MITPSLARSDREIGEVVGVTSIRVVVEVHEDLTSPVHSYPGGQSTIAQIGAYLMFPVGAGEAVVGVVIGAYQHEGYEPDPHGGMTLQLAKPRRTIHANLLGTVAGDGKFRHGVAVYPTLGSPALVPSTPELESILDASRRHSVGAAPALELGASPIYETTRVKALLDDLFSRPLALVGNTGSGKSWSLASIVQRCLEKLHPKEHYTPKFVILDVNGEYGQAFNSPLGRREPNRVYVNGAPFVLPVWALDFNEFLVLFGAATATQTQLPVLERITTIAREDAIVRSRCGPEADEAIAVLSEVRWLDLVLDAVRALRSLTYVADGKKVGEKANVHFSIVSRFLLAPPPHCQATLQDWQGTDIADLKVRCQQQVLAQMSSWTTWDHQYALPADCHEPLRSLCDDIEPPLTAARSRLCDQVKLPRVTADTPCPFDPSVLDRSELIDRAIAGVRSEERIHEYIATLRLRIRRLLHDRRWLIFREQWDTTVEQLLCAILGIEDDKASPVVVVDCSMLAHDVLPFFCAVVGRLLLDVREHAEPEQRISTPWVLVLEEAHNYLRPRREGEQVGLSLSREAFERIAKEGRKFGMSLVVASQRPSDISETVLSQCANFVVHRIQNPDDIEYFKRILPGGSREILDQVSILTPGEALLLGSAVNVPCRVRMWEPSPSPRSETPRPSYHWQADVADRFCLETAIGNWLQDVGRSPNATHAAAASKEERAQTDTSVEPL